MFMGGGGSCNNKVFWPKNTFYPIGNKNVSKVREEIGDHQACRLVGHLVIVNELELVKLKETSMLGKF